MKNTILWIIAFILTVTIAVYQRATGPTYPIESEITLNSKNYNYTLLRSHGGKSDHKVSLAIPDSNITANLYWKRFKTNDQFTEVEFTRNIDTLYAFLPYQPPAGKLEYYIKLNNKNKELKLPFKENVIIRFKGEVPLWILIPHIFFMFGAMLLSTRTGLEIFRKDHNVIKYTYWTLIFLGIGGFILGPLTQQYAFGALWTGFPFGTDLTDNKTLVALIGWLGALFMYKKSNKQTLWALIAAVLLIVVFLVPHSMMGSELDYNKMDSKKVENLTE